MTTKPKSTHGGPRPGAGGKPKERKVSRAKPVYIFEDQVGKLPSCLIRKLIDDEIQRLQV